jgi:flavin reductase (DIM6/NTAB) family NADH-FMN oxidoreductase RutF
MICLPVISWADDDIKYLAGAVPEIEGKVVFAKEFDLPGIDQNSIYEHVYNWLDGRMKANNNVSRIVFVEKEKGQIVASGEEYIVFSNNALSLDRSLMGYNVAVLCKPGKCEMQVERIRYNYGDKKYTAEEMISDNVTLNKKKTSIFRGYRKFRINTIDYVDNLFQSAGASFGVKEESVKHSLVAVQSQQSTPVPVVDNNQSTSSLQGYRQLSPDKIPGNIIKMLNEDWMIITAGTDEKFNMMTAGWGGLGVLYSKPVAICFINPANYTYQFMETSETYTFTFYTEAYRETLQYCGTNSGRDTDKVKGSGLTPLTTPSGSKAFSEAWLIIECRKFIGQSLNTETLFDEKVKAEWTGKQLPKMFIGEIINVWVK